MIETAPKALTVDKLPELKCLGFFCLLYLYFMGTSYLSVSHFTFDELIFSWASFPVWVVVFRQTGKDTHLESPWTGSILPRRWLSHMVSRSNKSSVRGHGCTVSAWSHSGTPRWPPPPGVPRTEAPGSHASRSAHTPGSSRRKAAGSAALSSLEQKVHASAAFVRGQKLFVRHVRTCFCVLK